MKKKIDPAYIILIILVIGFLLYQYISGEKLDDYFEKNSISTYAKIIEEEYNAGKRNYILSYNVDGKMFQTSIMHREYYDIGDIFEISYLPNNPESNRVFLSKPKFSYGEKIERTNGVMLSKSYAFSGFFSYSYYVGFKKYYDIQVVDDEIYEKISENSKHEVFYLVDEPHRSILFVWDKIDGEKISYIMENPPR